MMALDIAIIIFIIMEVANVVILYFAPDSKKGNGVAVFNNWFKAKEDEASGLFVKYMTNWVAGVKLIAILLLLVILFTGTEITKLLAVLAMIISISSYYFGLHPLITKLDARGEVSPPGYSKTLRRMITGFMFMFACAAIVYLFIR